MRSVIPQPIELLRSLPARPLARAQPRIESGKSAGTETLQIHGSRSAVDDQLGHRLAGRRRVEDTPDAVAGREVGPLDTRYPADHRQAVASDRTIARLLREDLCRGEGGRQFAVYRLQALERTRWNCKRAATRRCR